MNRNYVVKKMWLIHDWLFDSYDEAKKYDDGKDRPTHYYVILDEEDAKLPELEANGGLYLTEADALEELDELNNY